MKYIKENWLKIRECIFLFLLTAEIFLRLLERTRLDMRKPLGLALTAIELFWIPVLVGVLYAADVLVTGIRKNIKKMCIDGFIGVFFVIAAYMSTDFFILATGVFLVSSDKASLKNIAKAIAFALIAGTLVVGVLSQFGIIEDKLFDRFGRIAHSFGFRHYAFPARQLLFGWLAYVYGKTEKLSWVELIIEFGLIYALYYFTTQRLTFVIFVGVWLMYIVFVKCEIIKITSKFIKFCSAIGFTVCGGASIAASYFFTYSSDFFVMLNRFLNTRLYLGREAFNRYDVTLLGQFVKDYAIDSPEGYFYIDCGYLDVLLSLGLIMFIITTVVYTVMHIYSCVKNDTKLFVWMTGIMVYTIVDNVWLDLIGAGTAAVLFGAVLAAIRKERENKIL